MENKPKIAQAKSPLFLGPVGQGLHRDITLERLVFLEEANLFWWETVKRTSLIQSAIHSLYEGYDPSPVLVQQIRLALIRVSHRYPYIYWGKRKSLEGFWPKLETIAEGLRESVIYDVPITLGGDYTRIGKNQKYWIVYGQTYYELRAMNTKMIWHMEGTWMLGKSFHTALAERLEAMKNEKLTYNKDGRRYVRL